MADETGMEDMSTAEFVRTVASFGITVVTAGICVILAVLLKPIPAVGGFGAAMFFAYRLHVSNMKSLGNIYRKNLLAEEERVRQAQAITQVSAGSPIG